MPSKHHSLYPGQDSKMGRGPDHDHTHLARSKLVPREHETRNKATKTFVAISVAPLECYDQGCNSKGHENI